MQVNYLGHWLLTHQLLKGQQNLREKQMRFNSPNLVRAARTTTASSKVTNSNAWEPEHLLTADASGQASDEGTRVVLVSSMAHRAGRIQFDDLHAQKTYNPFRRYADSKLALLLALKAFAERTQRYVYPNSLQGSLVDNACMVNMHLTKALKNQN